LKALDDLYIILGTGIALIGSGLAMVYYLYRTGPGYRAHVQARRRQPSMPFDLSRKRGTAKKPSHM